MPDNTEPRVGKYKVEIVVDGAPAGAKDFEVK